MKRFYMKKTALLLPALLLALALCGAALAGAAADDQQSLRDAASFDEQLAILDKAASQIAEGTRALSSRDVYTVDAAPGLPEGVVPSDWAEARYATADGLPDALDARRYIAILCEEDSAPKFAGDLLLRFPASMRAASLAQAECALIVRWRKVESGYVYTPISITSYHRDYEAFAVDLRTGEMTKFWEHRNPAKTYGRSNELNGSIFTTYQLWEHLAAYFHGEL